MANENGDYRYRPLVQPRLIRILELHPAKAEDDIIRCDLQVTCLDDPLEYNALSYAWGISNLSSDVYTRWLVCDGALLPVTTNLHDALRNLRRPNSSRFIWADAICIDQKNAMERNSQVLMMPDIYHNARRTIVWLGEDSPAEDGRLSMQYIQDCSKFLSSTQKSVMPSQSSIPLATFSSWPWFERRWILQEIHHSRDIVMVCGHNELEWADLVGWIKFEGIVPRNLARSAMTGIPPRVGILPQITLLKDGQGLDTYGASPILERLSMFHDCKCSDDRDRVYAMLSFSKDCAFTPD